MALLFFLSCSRAASSLPSVLCNQRCTYRQPEYGEYGPLAVWIGGIVSDFDLRRQYGIIIWSHNDHAANEQFGIAGHYSGMGAVPACV